MMIPFKQIFSVGTYTLKALRNWRLCQCSNRLLMGDFFAEDEILQQRRAARIRPERVLIVRDREALVGSERGVLPTSDLVQFATGSRLCVKARGRDLFR